MRFYTQHAQTLLRHRSARPHDVSCASSMQQGEIASAPQHRRRPRKRSSNAVAPYRDDLVVARRVHVRLVLARRPVRRARDCLRARPRPVHEGDPRRQGQERQDRRRTRSPRCCAAACCRRPTSIRQRCARRAICCAGASPGAQARRAARAHPEHRQPVQPAAAPQAVDRYAANRAGRSPERFKDPSVRRSVELDLATASTRYDELLAKLEL